MPTEQQNRLLRYIKGHIQKAGYAPSIADLQRHFGFSSPTTVSDHLKAMERHGMIKREPGRSRAIKVLEDIDMDSIPVFGAIPAGLPEVATEGDLGAIRVDLASLGIKRTHPIFALKVRGNSMINAGILNDDVVILEAREARVNEIVAALVDGESTLKRLIKRKGKYCLKAENPDYPDIIPDTEMTIQGVMCALVRS